MSLKKDLDRLAKELDLKKHLPKGYINIWIIRSAFIIMLFYFLALLFFYGSDPFINVSCPDNGEVCLNPVYICPDVTLINPFCVTVSEAPPEALEFCSKFDICHKYYLSPGESYGDPPPYYVKNFKKIFFLILVLSFILNHAFYNMRRLQNGDDKNKTKKRKG